MEEERTNERANGRGRTGCRGWRVARTAHAHFHSGIRICGNPAAHRRALNSRNSFAAICPSLLLRYTYRVYKRVGRGVAISKDNLGSRRERAWRARSQRAVTMRARARNLGAYSLIWFSDLDLEQRRAKGWLVRPRARSLAHSNGEL